MNKPDQALANYIARLGVENQAVLDAIAKVPRAAFVDPVLQTRAYEDTALPIAAGQTISQPSLVARMLALMLAGKSKLHRVLEIGTGSGYQTALLSYLADEVYSIERIKVLLDQANEHFVALKLKNIKTRYGDGYLGWSEYAPYDGIIVTAAAPQVPAALLAQLYQNGGRLLIPVGEHYQWQALQCITRHHDQYEKKSVDTVAFVPMLSGKTLD